MKNNGIKIKILKVVWQELIRIYNSSDKEKAERANQAMSILTYHRNIFDIEDEQVFHDEMERAFADKTLLSNLILEKTESTILLITNDRMLSKDALAINHQMSCRGYRISTCYISNSGKLLSGYNSEQEIEKETEQTVITKEVVKIVRVSEKNSTGDVISKVVIPIATFAVGIVCGKYSNKLVHSGK